MGAVILGRYTRVRWIPASPAVISHLEASNATSLSATALLDGAKEAWGLSPDQPVLLRSCPGAKLDGLIDSIIARVPKLPIVSEIIALPRVGQWLVGVEHSGSMWGWLDQAKIVETDQVVFDWTALDLPGAGDLRLGRPRCGGEPFKLVAPPPFGGAFPAQLDGDGVLRTTPFQPEKGKHDDEPPEDADQLMWFIDGVCHHVAPRYRYGLLADGAMQWLNLGRGVRLATATPTTTLLRARLALFKRELASRGIFYEDDADETGYELRFAIEDGEVPQMFYEPNAALAYTVSGQGAPEEDKQAQARQLYDPEDDWETGQSYAIDYPTMPARVNVKRTELVFYTSEYTTIGGVQVDDTWATAHLDYAGVAAGLDFGASTFPALTVNDQERLNGADGQLAIRLNAVDAADRVQRAAYALATGGKPDPEVEARLSRLRGAIVRVLLGQPALDAAEAGNYTYAKEISATLLPLAPGPFPRRAYAVIGLVKALGNVDRRTAVIDEVLQTVDDRFERKLALLFADRTSVRHTPGLRAAAWSESEALNAVSWGAEVVEPLLGSLEPP